MSKWQDDARLRRPGVGTLESREAELRPEFEAVLDALAATSAYTLDCIFVLDPQWRFRHLNARAEREIALGRDLLGTVIWNAFPGALEGEFGGPYMAAMLNQVPKSFEAHYPPLGGWYEVQATPIGGGLLVSFRNINDRKEAEQELRDAKQRYKLAALATNDLVYDWDLAAGGLRRCESLHDRFGYLPFELGSTPEWWESRIHPDDRARIAALFAGVAEQRNDSLECHYRWRRADGSYAEVHDRSYLMQHSSSASVSLVGAMQDLTDEYALQVEAARARNLLQTVIDSVPDHIYVKDSSGLFVLTNQASEESWGLLGRRTGDVLPAEIAALVDGSDQEVMASGVAHTVEEQAPLNGQMRVFQSVKVPWRQDGEIRGVIGISRDITDQKAVDDQVRWSANHDSLTKLPNRAFFQSCLSSMISDAVSAGRQLSLLHVDLDHFKQVNDSLGHDGGDALLRDFARRLQGSLRSTDVVARLGGDEFAIILPGCGAEQAAAAAEKIISSLRKPFVHDDRLLDCRASIGVGVFPTHGTSPEELLKNADMALYAAKADGRGNAKLFESSIRNDIQRRLSMLSLGRKALNDQQLFPYYQPKIDLSTGAVKGFEALLRWQHPRLGLGLPESIAACFEDHDLSAEISDRVVTCVVDDMRAWLDQGLEFGSIAVNAGAAEFRTGSLAERILCLLQRSGVPTSCFQLEVTETVFLGRGSESVEKDLKLLSTAGVKIALDDFGTGYASLRHLKQFPVDIIKIDQSFVRNLHEHKDDAAIVKAVINLGQSLGLEVVAEGIESRSQEAALRQLGCGYGQGFLYSKAFPATHMPNFLQNRPTAAAWRQSA